ncbi:MAG TPA: hypothetical protein VM735_07920 [Candidatus Kapabacteria bacterium]|nr:hypothetical protein [Candidatus Kapabacteria bacterium]
MVHGSMFTRWVLSLVLTFASAALTINADAAISIKKMPYHNWSEAFTIGNGSSEVVVVAAIGRVMQFRWAGETDGPFWENPRLHGKAPDSQSLEWINFGGDKSWPAPQGDWEKSTGRGWPPPAAFDAVAVSAKVESESLILQSPVDQHYGIEVERRIRLHKTEAELEIETIYHKKQGDPVRVAVWTITQLKDPELVVMPLPAKSIFPLGYNKQSEALPLDLKVENNRITCRRSPKLSTKIGSDAGQLIWVGPKTICEIYAPREEGEFPDNNSSAEIYTNPDPLDYVELELLGPLKMLKQGDKLSRKQIYRLHRRDSRPLDEQLSKIVRK